MIYDVGDSVVVLSWGEMLDKSEIDREFSVERILPPPPYKYCFTMMLSKFCDAEFTIVSSNDTFYRLADSEGNIITGMYEDWMLRPAHDAQPDLPISGLEVLFGGET